MLYRLEQLLHGDGLFQKSHGANAGRLYRSVYGGVTAHHDDRHIQQTRAGPFLEQGDAVCIRHPDIQQHQIGLQLRANGARLGSIHGQFDLMAFVIENFKQQVTDAKFIVDH